MEYLFCANSLSNVFRAKYCDKLKAADNVQYQKLRKALWEKEWVVFAKRPFGSSRAVVEYLGRYTHKISISNHRILSIVDKNITFSYKDNKQKGKKKVMVLTHEEFIRRFAQHILPKRFVKIRHSGFLSSNWKRKKLKEFQEKPQVVVVEKVEKTLTFSKCPCCKTGNLHIILIFDKRGPPAFYRGARQTQPACEN